MRAEDWAVGLAAALLDVVEPEAGELKPTGSRAREQLERPLLWRSGVLHLVGFVRHRYDRGREHR